MLVVHFLDFCCAQPYKRIVREEAGRLALFPMLIGVPRIIVPLGRILPVLRLVGRDLFADFTGEKLVPGDLLKRDAKAGAVRMLAVSVADVPVFVVQPFLALAAASVPARVKDG